MRVRSINNGGFKVVEGMIVILCLLESTLPLNKDPFPILWDPADNSASGRCVDDGCSVEGAVLVEPKLILRDLARIDIEQDEWAALLAGISTANFSGAERGAVEDDDAVESSKVHLGNKDGFASGSMHELIH